MNGSTLDENTHQQWDLGGKLIVKAIIFFNYFDLFLASLSVVDLLIKKKIP